AVKVKCGTILEALTSLPMRSASPEWRVRLNMGRRYEVALTMELPSGRDTLWRDPEGAITMVPGPRPGDAAPPGIDAASRSDTGRDSCTTSLDSGSLLSPHPTSLQRRH